jgi:Uma2 family endonuclease
MGSVSGHDSARPPASDVKLTYDDFVHFPDDGKRHERYGVVEYWVVDPELDEIRVYRRADGRYERVALLSAEQGDVLTSPLFPGLELPLAEVFAE